MNKTFKRLALSIGMALSTSLCLAPLAPVAMAQSQDGSVAGQSEPGAEITVRTPGTGFSRTTTAGSDGSFHFPFLPVGTYTLQVSRDGQPIGTPKYVAPEQRLSTTLNDGDVLAIWPPIAGG